MIRTLAQAVIIATLTAAPAWAQSGGTAIKGGGIPHLRDTPSTVDSGAAGGSVGGRNVDQTGSLRTGKVKPPGAPVGEHAGTRPDLDRKSQEIDRRIRSGICKGC